MAQNNNDIDYSPRALKAKENFENGFNCCQATLLAFGDLTGLDPETSCKIASSFGGGIGRLREVCGAFSGACMALGMICGSNDPNDKQSKTNQYKQIQTFAEQFRRDNGSIICRELLGLQEKQSEPTPETRTTQYYHKRPCALLCAYATHTLENLLAKADE
ncbi:MAG: C-GCAxxG-C-C family protein [Planctomycetia bacterium]|nr:C-GCAxxG-C-C family protein [Planctomycetia bacterium]